MDNEKKYKEPCKNSGLSILSIILAALALVLIFVFIFGSNQINSFSSTEDAVLVPVSGLITFDTNRVVEGTAISHTPGSFNFIINEAGTYYVAFNISVFEPADPGVAAILSTSLQQNGALVTGSTARGTVGVAFQVVNLSSSVIIEANAGDVLTVINDSTVPIDVLQPNINIIKTEN